MKTRPSPQPLTTAAQQRSSQQSKLRKYRLTPFEPLSRPQLGTVVDEIMDARRVDGTGTHSDAATYEIEDTSASQRRQSQDNPRGGSTVITFTDYTDTDTDTDNV
jgi:hypothetical protein